MELLLTHFNRAKKSLALIEIRRGMVNFNISDLYDLPTCDPDPIFEEHESIVFYSGDGSEFDASLIIDSVFDELKDNLTMPIEAKIIEDYLVELLNHFSILEESIIEENEGKFASRMILPVGFAIDDLNERDQDIFNSTILDLKRSLRAFIKKVNDIKNKLGSKAPLKISKSKKSVIINSFSIDDKMLKHSEFELFAKELKQKYVNYNDFRDFKKIFSGLPIENQVEWIGSQGALKYFIVCLKKKNLIAEHKSIYQTTALCFKYKENTPINPVKLSHDHFPTDKRVIDDIDDAVAHLIDLELQ